MANVSVKKLGQYFPLPMSKLALQTVAVSQENSRLINMFTPSNLLEEVASDSRKLFVNRDNHSCVLSS